MELGPAAEAAGHPGDSCRHVGHRAERRGKVFRGGHVSKMMTMNFEKRIFFAGKFRGVGGEFMEQTDSAS